ncbi:TRAF3-interacting protein 1 [Blomia tropicalis]|nr:TRAF3-interacting protein 1 [Blomia tropicalis]
MVTEKILSRPPFKFLHELTTLIVKTTGYLRGLFTDEEFSLQNIDTKDAKLAFLDKLIDAIGFINSKVIDVKSTKIVAGLEVEKTNRLLNEFAKAVTDKKPFLEAVEKVRKGLKPESGEITKASNVSSKQTKKSTIVNATNKQTPKSTTLTTKNNQPQTKVSATKEKIDQKKVDIPINEMPVETEKSISPTLEPEPTNLESPKAQTVSNSVEVSTNNSTINILEASAALQLEQKNEIEKEVNEPKLEPIIDPPKINEYAVNEPNLDNMDKLIADLGSDKSSDVAMLQKDEEDARISQEILDNEPAELNTSNRRKSSTLRSSRRTSKSSIPSQPIGGKVNSTNRSQNVPSSAAPVTLITKSTIIDNASNIASNINESVTNNKTNNRQSARPSSSRPAPPRVKTASRSRLMMNQIEENDGVAAIGNESGKQPETWKPPIGLNLDMNDDDVDQSANDDADEYVINTRKLQDSLMKMDQNDRSVEAQFDEAGQSDKGRLVQQLLATKNELEGTIEMGNNSQQQQPIDLPNLNTSTDLNQLRTNVHELCQSIGGLAKALNYLHEDVDPMMNEHTKWRDEYRSNLIEIERLRSKSEKEIEPLRKELDVIELEVADYVEKLRNAKAAVHRNSTLIAKLIESV